MLNTLKAIVKILSFIIYAYTEFHLGNTKYGSVLGYLLIDDKKSSDQQLIKFTSGGVMNIELKAMLQLVLDVFHFATDAQAKKNSVILFQDLFKIASSDVPAVVASFHDLSAEIEALKDSQVQADLLTFIQKNFAAEGTSAIAQEILAKALNVIQTNANFYIYINGIIKK